MPRPPLRAALGLALVALCLAGCSDDRSDVATADTEATDAPTSAAAEANQTEPTPTSEAANEPALSAIVEGGDERYPGSWQLDFFLTECQEEVINAVDTAWTGCLTLEAHELEDEYDGLYASPVQDSATGSETDSVYVGLVGGLPGSYVELHTLMRQPPDADRYPDALRCDGTWCVVLGHGFEEATDPIPRAEDLATSLTDSNYLFSTGAFTPDDVIYVLLDGEGEVIGAVDAQGQDVVDEVASYFA